MSAHGVAAAVRAARTPAREPAPQSLRCSYDLPFSAKLRRSGRDRLWGPQHGIAQAHLPTRSRPPAPAVASVGIIGLLIKEEASGDDRLSLTRNSKVVLTRNGGGSRAISRSLCARPRLPHLQRGGDGVVAQRLAAGGERAQRQQADGLDAARLRGYERRRRRTRGRGRQRSALVRARECAHKGTHLREAKRLELALAAGREPLVEGGEALAVREDVEQRVQPRVLGMRRERLYLRRNEARRCVGRGGALGGHGAGKDEGAGAGAGAGLSARVRGPFRRPRRPRREDY